MVGLFDGEVGFAFEGGLDDHNSPNNPLVE
jgi:hypothetical protein